MRILGIDYGTIRLGVAISDPLGIIAQPLEVIPRDENCWSALRRYQELYQVEKIVVGYPRHLSGAEGTLAPEVEQFTERLGQELSIEVEFWDERLSTQGAERVLIDEFDLSRSKRRQIRDKMAAVFFLQGYLDYKRQNR